MFVNVPNAFEFWLNKGRFYSKTIYTSSQYFTSEWTLLN